MEIDNYSKIALTYFVVAAVTRCIPTKHLLLQGGVTLLQSLVDKVPNEKGKTFSHHAKSP